MENKVTTICKFKCNTVTHFESGRSVNLTPVMDGSAENKEFWKYTPSGSLDLNYLNDKVVFVPGKEYYINIAEA